MLMVKGDDIIFFKTDLLIKYNKSWQDIYLMIKDGATGKFSENEKYILENIELNTLRKYFINLDEEESMFLIDFYQMIRVGVENEKWFSLEEVTHIVNGGTFEPWYKEPYLGNFEEVYKRKYKKDSIKNAGYKMMRNKSFRKEAEMKTFEVIGKKKVLYLNSEMVDTIINQLNVYNRSDERLKNNFRRKEELTLTKKQIENSLCEVLPNQYAVKYLIDLIDQIIRDTIVGALKSGEVKIRLSKVDSLIIREYKKRIKLISEYSVTMETNTDLRKFKTQFFSSEGMAEESYYNEILNFLEKLESSKFKKGKPLINRLNFVEYNKEIEKRIVKFLDKLIFNEIGNTYFPSRNIIKRKLKKYIAENQYTIEEKDVDTITYWIENKVKKAKTVLSYDKEYCLETFLENNLISYGKNRRIVKEIVEIPAINDKRGVTSQELESIRKNLEIISNFQSN